MSNGPQTSSGDITNWDWLAQNCDKISGLSPLEREKAKRAFMFLKKELGVDFLISVLEKRHPIMFGIMNMVAWTRKYFIWFAEAMEELKSQENYSSFIARIKDTSKYLEAVSVLTEAHRFCQAGFSVEIDPLTGSSIPDLKIIDSETNEEIFVEVSMLFESKAKAEASSTFLQILNSLLGTSPFLHWSGRIHKTLSTSHCQEVVEKIRAMLQKVQKRGKIGEVNIRGIIELAVAPDSDKSMLQKWADERQLKIGSFEGPPYDANEVVRVRRKIEREQKQLPVTGSNIVIIQNNDIFDYLNDIRKLISALEEEVYKYEHLLIVVVSGSHIGNGRIFNTMKDQHIYVEKLQFDVIVYKHILLLNRFCKFRISPRLITKVYTAFMEH